MDDPTYYLNEKQILKLFTNESNKPHRPYKDGPAIIHINCTMEFWENGKPHRPYKDGPAIIHLNKEFKESLHYMNSSEINKFIEKISENDYNNDYVSFYIYYTNGVRYRPSHLGPTLGGKNTRYNFYNNENGITHRPVELGKAMIDNLNKFYLHDLLNNFIDNSHYYENGEFITESDAVIIAKDRINAANKIHWNFKRAKHNRKYLDLYAQVLCIPENHDSVIGRLFPNGGIDFQKMKQLILNF
jgi:hypothetical protein